MNGPRKTDFLFSGAPESIFGAFLAEKLPRFDRQQYVHLWPRTLRAVSARRGGVAYEQHACTVYAPA